MRGMPFERQSRGRGENLTAELSASRKDTLLRLLRYVLQNYKASSTSYRAPSQTKILYLAAPSVDGSFPSVSSREQIGKSIYQLTTDDDHNGTFVILDSNDAIATAMISVSQFIKPVCKVKGSTAQYPRHIITEEEGTAAKEGGVWKVVRKAVVRFE